MKTDLASPSSNRRAHFLKIALALPTLLLAVPALLLAAPRREVVEKKFPAASIREISVENVNGDVVVAAGSGDQIEMTAEKSVRGGDADELLEQLRIDIRETAGRLEIKTIQPKRKKFLGLFDVGSSEGCTVRYAIKVPADRSVRLETVNGSINVSGIEGKLQVETVNGSVALSGARGEVDASSVNGSVAVVRGAGLAAMRLETVNGNVEIALDRGSAFNFSFETVNGSIDSDFPLTVTGKFGPKSAHGAVGAGGVTITAESVNGSIRIRGK